MGRGRKRQHKEEDTSAKASALDMAFFMRNGNRDSKKQRLRKQEEEDVADKKRLERKLKKDRKQQPEKKQPKEQPMSIQEKARVALVVELRAAHAEARAAKDWEKVRTIGSFFHWNICTAIAKKRARLDCG